jgi:hypothetical protein
MKLVAMAGRHCPEYGGINGITGGIESVIFGRRFFGEASKSASDLGSMSGCIPSASLAQGLL